MLKHLNDNHYAYRKYEVYCFEIMVNLLAENTHFLYLFAYFSIIFHILTDNRMGEIFWRARLSESRFLYVIMYEGREEDIDDKACDANCSLSAAYSDARL